MGTGRVEPCRWLSVYQCQSSECGPCGPGFSLFVASHAGDADSAALGGFGLGEPGLFSSLDKELGIDVDPFVRSGWKFVGGVCRGVNEELVGL